MSLKDLDALLSTPIGKRPKQAISRKKKRQSRKAARQAEDQRRMQEIERALERARDWRLTAAPVETRIFVQRTTCISCHCVEEATISSPMIAYRDRRGRTHSQRTDLIPRDLPVEIYYTDLRVPACQHCAKMCCRGAAPEGWQKDLRFDRKAKSMSRALVPLQHTPQHLMLSFHTLHAEEIINDNTDKNLTDWLVNDLSP